MFINCFGSDDAWINTRWFDSESLLQQVKDWSNMKRTIATHAATLIAVNVLILLEIWRWYDDWNSKEDSK